MAAANTDFWTEVGNPGTATNLAAPGHTIGGTAFTVVSTTNWPTSTGAIFAIDNYDITTGLRVPGSYTEWEGVVASATSITSGTLRYGTDQNYSAGSTTRVYIPVASSRENRLAQGLQIEHDQDGTHGAITTTSINNAGSLTQTGASTLTGTLTIKSYDGWITDTHTWTYASGATTNQATFTVAGVDLTGVYQVGDKVKFTQTTVKYGIVVKTAFSTDTTVSIYMGTDYTIANAAITAPAFSHDRSPAGFPSDPIKWTVTVTSANNRTNFGNNVYATLTDAITVPVGSFRLVFEGVVEVATTVAASRRAYVTLSADASTETNPNTTGVVGQTANSTTSTTTMTTIKTEDNVTPTTATAYTLLGKVNNTTSTTTSLFGSSIQTTVIRAICNYL